ncbi:helix-turn-helix transcriptional regulator [Actinophytocola sediminis]
MGLRAYRDDGRCGPRRIPFVPVVLEEAVVGERRGPQPWDRRIGARLRAVRTGRTPYSLEKAAELLGWSLATMSRIENGRRPILSEEVATIVTAYGLSASERLEIIEDAKSVNCSGWWDSPLPGVPEEVGVLAGYAKEADSLTNWSVALVPGLLQVEAYAMALMRSDGIPEEDSRLRWEARRCRQKILGTVDYTAYICETALRVPFGGPAAHRQQLSHLVAARERGVSVRVVRQHLPVGLLSHSWLHMTFPSATPVVNVEVLGGGVYLVEEQAERYTKKLELLDRVALSRAESFAGMRKLLEAVDDVA